MKSTFISVLAVMFCMLVIPLISLPDKSDTALQAAAVNNGNNVYEKNANDYAYEEFKILKNGKVLELSAKDYIFGVVAAEMPALYEAEALKAQAVAAYTFACYRKQGNTDSEYDLTADSETAQCFITREEAAARWGEKSDEYTKKIEDCIAEVEGELLTFDDKPIFAAYHAISSGSTNSCYDVWGKEISYLKSVVSDGDKLAEGYLSEAVFTAEEIAENLKSITAASGDAQNYFSELNATDNGYVKTLKFCGKETTGSEISKLLGLRSGSFSVEFTEAGFKFTVKGYGHGVGMSQTGADYMAKQGSSYEEILLHYYNGATLQKN